MNMDNTPNTGSGPSSAAPTPQGGSSVNPAPVNVSGPGANQSQTQGNSNQTQVNNPNSGLTPEAQQILEQYRTQSFQKITELGQSNAELRKQLQSIQSQQEQRNLALAQALGYAPKEQQVDLITELMDNPAKLDEIINKRLEERMTPLQEKLELRETGEFLAVQDQTRMSLEASLKQNFTEDIVTAVLDIKSYLPPQIVQLYNALSDPNAMLSHQEREQGAKMVQKELRKVLENSGGYEALIDRNLGKMLRGNMGPILQSAARAIEQQRMQVGRAGGYNSFTNGASMGQPSQGVGVQYNSESVYR